MNPRLSTSLLLVAVVGSIPRTADAAEYPYTAEGTLDTSDIAAVAKPQFADLDADGDQDVVLVGSQSLWWYENDGELGEQMIERRVDPTLIGVDEVAVGDVDGDADLDLVVTGGPLRWYENVQNAAAFTAHTIDAEDVEGEVAIGDFDGDGDADVMVAEYWEDELHWYVNPGAGVEDWGAARVVPSSIVTVNALLAADLDADGRDDLLAADVDAYAFVRLRYADGPWTEDALDPGSGGITLRAVDIDDDGDLDVLCGQPRHAVLLRNLDGVLAHEQIEDMGNIIVDYRLDAGDVDGDGDLDVVAVTHGAETAIRWFPNDAGQFGERQTILDGFWNSRGMDVADADCDGDADVVAHGDSGFWRIATFTNETLAPGPDACAGGGGEESGGEESGGTPSEDSGGEPEGTTGDAPPSDDTTSTTASDDDGSGTDGPPPGGGQNGGGGLCSVGGDRTGFAALVLLLGLGLARRRRLTA